jgi:hypothetical protein
VKTDIINCRSEDRLVPSTLENPNYRFKKSAVTQRVQSNEYLEIKVDDVNLVNTFYNINDEVDYIKVGPNDTDIVPIPPGSYRLQQLINMINDCLTEHKIVCEYIDYKNLLEIRAPTDIYENFGMSADMALKLGYDNFEDWVEYDDKTMVIQANTSPHLMIFDIDIETDIPIQNTYTCSSKQSDERQNAIIASLSAPQRNFQFNLQSKERKFKLPYGFSLPSIKFYLKPRRSRITQFTGRYWDIDLMITKYRDTSIQITSHAKR